MAAQVPLQIGRYRIVGVVGAWEHGWVYRGRDDLLEREVWIKILPPNRRANDDTFVARFKDTIRRASGVPPVSSPNIVRVFECGSDAGLLYTVSEAFEGRTLLETIEDGISLRVGLPIILQVLDGLAHLHETGIVHGDIQPANVFVCSDGCAKIMNFAHARFTDAASGAAESARSTDLLRVGAMLYEMVKGNNLTAQNRSRYSRPRSSPQSRASHRFHPDLSGIDCDASSPVRSRRSPRTATPPLEQCGQTLSWP